MQVASPFPPAKFLDQDIINAYKNEYMFISCIEYIQQVCPYILLEYIIKSVFFLILRLKLVTSLSIHTNYGVFLQCRHGRR